MTVERLHNESAPGRNVEASRTPRGFENRKHRRSRRRLSSSSCPTDLLYLAADTFPLHHAAADTFSLELIMKRSAGVINCCHGLRLLFCTCHMTNPSTARSRSSPNCARVPQSGMTRGEGRVDTSVCSWSPPLLNPANLRVQ